MYECSCKDIRGNFNEAAVKTLKMRNNKAMSPFFVSVDEGNYEIFKLVLEFYYFND
jgi:hypothetical protein